MSAEPPFETSICHGCRWLQIVANSSSTFLRCTRDEGVHLDRDDHGNAGRAARRRARQRQLRRGAADCGFGGNLLAVWKRTTGSDADVVGVPIGRCDRPVRPAGRAPTREPPAAQHFAM